MFRFILSPTGDMHIRSIRTALFNFICAKQRNNRFVMRIANIEKEKNIEGKEQDIS